MGSTVRKRARLTQRMRRVTKELSAVDADIRSLSRKIGKRSDELLSSAASPPVLIPSNDTQAGSDVAATHGNNPRQTKEEDERFVGYLMRDGIRTEGPLRRERHVQRNKAIFVVVLFVLALFVFLYFAVFR